MRRSTQSGLVTEKVVFSCKPDVANGPKLAFRFNKLTIVWGSLSCIFKLCFPQRFNLYFPAQSGVELFYSLNYAREELELAGVAFREWPESTDLETAKISAWL